MDNGMEPDLADRTVRSYRVRDEEIKSADDDNEWKNRIIIRLPYVVNFSLKLKRRLKKEAGVDVVFRKGVTIKDHIWKLQPAKTALEMKGSIYHIPCKDCDKPYVGETMLRLIGQEGKPA